MNYCRSIAKTKFFFAQGYFAEFALEEETFTARNFREIFAFRGINFRE